jgi:hypothetical protein
MQQWGLQCNLQPTCWTSLSNSYISQRDLKSRNIKLGFRCTGVTATRHWFSCPHWCQLLESTIKRGHSNLPDKQPKALRRPISIWRAWRLGAPLRATSSWKMSLTWTKHELGAASATISSSWIRGWNACSAFTGKLPNEEVTLLCERWTIVQPRHKQACTTFNWNMSTALQHKDGTTEVLKLRFSALPMFMLWNFNLMESIAREPQNSQ